MLAENAGQVVSKDDLMAHVWPDTTVNEEGLVQCIADIRRAIGGEDKSIIEGSQQFDGNTLRVTIPLIDAESGAHVLSDKLDRDIGDILEIQDQIVRRIASTISSSVKLDAPKRHSSNETIALLLRLEARSHMTHYSKENWQMAVALEEKSVRLYADAVWGHIGKALLPQDAAGWDWMDRPREDVLGEAAEHADKALNIAQDNCMSHRARERDRSAEFDEAILHFERAASLNPSDSRVLIGMSVPLLCIGQNERALEVLTQAQEIDPLHGDWLKWQQGWAY